MSEEASVEKLPGGIWRLSGELTFATVPRLVESTGPELDARQGVLKIDLEGVSRADSAGLVLLIGWLRRARRQGVRILFCKVPEQLLKIARVSGLESVLPFDSGVE
ncbi:MAG TPA: anti-sigma factor antagonist [Gammaproteobacteria bacterium]|nr:anti-sigma factor antagonist [Gammaproteobacteria bacterium]